MFLVRQILFFALIFPNLINKSENNLFLKKFFGQIYCYSKWNAHTIFKVNAIDL